MSVVNIGECDCDCHKSGSRKMHIMACCTICEYCDKRIRNGMMSVHFSHCTARVIKDTAATYPKVDSEIVEELLGAKIVNEDDVRNKFKTRKIPK